MVIVVETQVGCCNGLRFCNAKLLIKVAHLQFANDTVAFCDADQQLIMNLKMVLKWFEITSGLKIRSAMLNWLSRLLICSLPMIQLHSVMQINNKS